MPRRYAEEASTKIQHKYTLPLKLIYDVNKVAKMRGYMYPSHYVEEILSDAVKEELDNPNPDIARARAKRASTIAKYRVKYKRLRILYRGRIERRIWQEKEANPEGMVGLTLDYGFDNAQDILKEGVRRRAGRMRLVR